MEDQDIKVEDSEYREPTDNEKKLLAFILAHKLPWKQHRVTEYDGKWDEYERLWRGIWKPDDKTRDSERSRFIAPALQRAIESRLAEQEEVIFGQGSWFDISDDWKDKERTDTEEVLRNLHEDFKKDKVEAALNEAMLIAEITGTGIGEILVEKGMDSKPAERPLKGTNVKMVGREDRPRVKIPLLAIHPKNFIIDPSVDAIDKSLGVGIERHIPLHSVIQDMEKGIYKKCHLSTARENDDTQTYYRESDPTSDTVLILRWYGLVPRKYLEKEDPKDYDLKGLLAEDQEEEEEDSDNLLDMQEMYEDLVEAVVVIANDEVVLKADESPYMMKDRPVVAYRPDIVPGRFWGRGTAEKAYNMQKAIDGQMRMHFDSAALTAAPMIASDATKLPKGFKFISQPGKHIVTTGNPQEAIFPIKLGQTDPVSMQTTQALEIMLQNAAGTSDATIPMPQQQGQVRMDPVVSEIIKKSRRALINLQANFIIPFVQKAAWRYQQFAPERYPSKDFEFIPISTLGMMQREHEQFKLLGVLQTLGPESPIVPMVLQSVIATSSLKNREELSSALKKMSEPTPEKKQQEQKAQMMKEQHDMLLIRKLDAEVKKAEAEAAKALAESKAIPMEVRAKLIAALSNNLDEDAESKDFKQRLELTDRVLAEKKLSIEEKDVDSNFAITKMQMENQKADKQDSKQMQTTFERFNQRLEDILNAEEEVIRDEKGRIAGKRKKLAPRKEPASINDIADKVNKLN